MAVTQYIGARYVPRFFENSDGTAEWRSGVEYEPLTIVTYNSNSYTSKKHVPANVGNPSDNPDYWASTGIYNAQVEQFRQEVIQYKEETEEELAELEAKIEEAGTRKVIVISDSYADTDRGGYARGWYTRFISKAGLTDGTDVFLYARGGAGFYGNGQGVTFEDLLDAAISEHTTDAAEITDIFVVGGDNDADHPIANINTAKNSFFTTAHGAFTNAIVTLAMVGGFVNVAARKRLITNVQYAWYYNNPYYVRVVENAMLPMYLSNSIAPDGIHPTSKGCTRIGDLIASVYLNKSIDGVWTTKTIMNANLPAATGVNVGLYGRLRTNSNMIEITAPADQAWTLSTSQTGAYNTGFDIPLCTCSNSYDSDFPVANAESVDDSQPVYRIQATAFGFMDTSGTFSWIPMDGELIGVADESNNTTWHLRIRSCVLASATITQLRLNYLMGHII